MESHGRNAALQAKSAADRWRTHVLNSVAVASLIPAEASVVDVGSGAGLPGIPLAIARPDLSVVLLESLLRRVTFLAEVVAELGLGDRVRVVRGRAEECTEHFDVVTARAVAPLGRLVGWADHLFLPSGQLLALKGSSADKEVAEAQAVLRKRRLVADVQAVRAAASLEETFVVRVRSVSRETRPVR